LKFSELAQTSTTTMRWTTSLLLGALAASTNAQLIDGQSPPSYPSPWMHGGNGWDDAYVKAKAFVSQLTLLEKVNLTTGVGWTNERCVGNTGSIPRLGFPGLCMQDSPLGIRFADEVSAFPAGINAAATWSTRLFRERGAAMGAEHRGKGIDVQLGPVAGPLGRSPEGGRNWEGFSPDPVLTGVAMAETIKGIQSSGVVACAKHFLLNEQEHFREQLSSNADDKTLHELYLWPFADAVKAGVGSVMCSYNQLNNSYACQNSYLINHILKDELDFQGFVMSDWNAQHSTVASALSGLDMTMPGDIGFSGSGVSFWGANLTAAVINGTVPQWRLDDMVVRIMASYYKIGRDKTAVPVNFSSWTKNTSSWLHPFAKEDWQVVNEHVNVQDNHKAIIREIGQRSNVLLKNQKKALPLKKPKSIAVIGEDAHPNPDGPNACPDRGCDVGTLAMGWGSGTADFPYLIAPLDALRAQAAADKTAFRNFSNNYDLSGAKAAAKGASAALVFANADSGEGYIDVDGNLGDRKNLTLWQGADELIAAVASVNPNTIVVLHTVGPVIVEALKQNPNVTAIIWAGLPGQESGNAITDVLYGKVNPSGKSVFTWGKARSDWGVDIVYDSPLQNPQVEFKEGVFIDYRHFDKQGITPSYEFGFGLSYTTFEYSDMQIRALHPGAYKPASGLTKPAPTFGTIDTDVSANGFPPAFRRVVPYVYPYIDATTVLNGSAAVPPHSHDSDPQPKPAAGGGAGGNPGLYDALYEVSATITNTGDRDGIEVAQLYVSLGGSEDPTVQLRAFDDLAVPCGGKKVFKAVLTRRDLSDWDPVAQDWVMSKYPKRVFVGSSSRKLLLKGILVGTDGGGY
jgi:beta-glucosidase